MKSFNRKCVAHGRTFLVLVAGQAKRTPQNPTKTMVSLKWAVPPLEIFRLDLSYIY